MGEYRSYLKNQNQENKGTQKKRRRQVFSLILVLALVAYMGASDKLAMKKLVQDFTPEAVDVMSRIDEVRSTARKVDKANSIPFIDTLNDKIKKLADILYSSTYGDRELPIYSVDTKEKKIAISFDSAWGAEDFDNIMETLDKHKVKATYFMTGSWVEDNPECVKTLVEKGHDLGNHSEHHYDMTTLTDNEIKEEIMKVHDKVKEIAGYDMKLFRPPYGAYDNKVIKAAYDLEYYPIEWSVDSLDWKDYGVDSIINTVCNHEALEPGAIILCHNGAKYTAKALDKLLTNLEEKGYEFVPISELIMKDNYHMDVTGRQIAD